VTTAELLERLSRLGVEVRGEEGTLKLSAPPGVLHPALRAELGARKPEILAYLAARADAIVPTARAVKASGLPLSFGQQRMWVVQQMHADSPFYNCPAAFRIFGPLDRSALVRALAEVVRRHEVLRTAIRAETDRPLQYPDGHCKLAVPEVAQL